MPYYEIEDGHTGVSHEMLARKEFIVGGQQKEAAVVELTDAVERKFLVFHMQRDVLLKVPLFTYVGFRFFHCCPLYEECSYLILASSETTKKYGELKNKDRLSVYMNDVITLIQRGANIWQRLESGWDQVNELIRGVGGNKLPSLGTMLQVLPEYEKFKKESEKRK